MSNIHDCFELEVVRSRKSSSRWEGEEGERGVESCNGGGGGGGGWGGGDLIWEIW